jgi:serine/threonine-protein kinase HipA
MNDFLKSATAMGLEQNVVINLIENMHKAVPKWRSLIQSSFLTADMKEKYEQLVMLRLDRLHV